MASGTDGVSPGGARPGVTTAEEEAAQLDQGEEGEEEEAEEEEEEEEGIPIVTVMDTMLSRITILDMPPSASPTLGGARVLLLGSPGGRGTIASVFFPDKLTTGSYWDTLAALPPLLPPGPIGILGLAAGTVARTVLGYWPHMELDAWEIDQVVVDMGRRHMALGALEAPSPQGGRLRVHVGDALAASARVDGGFAGLIVDLFQDHCILPQLTEPSTWVQLKGSLRAGGRIMVNCGGRSAPPDGDAPDPGWAACMAALAAISAAFPGEVTMKEQARDDDNFLALTGPAPDAVAWSAQLPDDLRQQAVGWLPPKSFDAISKQIGSH